MDEGYVRGADVVHAADVRIRWCIAVVCYWRRLGGIGLFTFHGQKYRIGFDWQNCIWFMRKLGLANPGKRAWSLLAS
jgi:hypothetical protein